MTKLNQIIAVASSKKSYAESALTKAYHLLQKPELFNGIERKYQPKDDDGEQLPSESTKVQFRVESIIADVMENWVKMFDVVLTQDAGNMEAKADVVVDERIILKDIPVTTLLFLEKQFTNFVNLINRIPVISESDTWNFNNDHEIYISDEVETHRTKKIQKAIVLYDATDKHPAQTQLITEDVLAGFWKTKKLSSALSLANKELLMKRVVLLKEAVIKAREQANSIEIQQLEQGENVVKYLFEGVF